MHNFGSQSSIILSGLILSMDWITPFDWNLPDRQITGVRTRDEFLNRLKSLLQTKTAQDGFIITWGYHHYYHGSISRPVLVKLS